MHATPCRDRDPRHLRGLLLLTFLLAAACSEEAVDAPVPNYASHVAPILDAHCASCHRDGGPAPFRLDTYDHAKVVAAILPPSVTSRAMPPWGVDNSGACNTFQHARWLSDEEMSTLLDWVEIGAPEGDPSKRASKPAAPDTLVDPSLTLTLPKYTPKATQGSDDYRCFVLKTGKDFKGYLTAYEVRPGSQRTVHHVIVYEAGSTEAAAAATALDASEDGPGYTCFGGPRVAPFQVLAGWAPGTGTTRLPDGVGLNVSPESTLIVQVHYSVGGGAEEDQTAIDVRLEPSVTHFALARILGDGEMMLPAAVQDAVASMDFGGADFGVGELTIHGVFPHMHKRGLRMRVELVEADGKSACVAHTPKWDFNWQQFYFFEKPIVVPADAVLRVECHFDTSGDADPIPFGDKTADEMCVLAVVASVGKTANAVALTTTAPDDALPDVRGPAPGADWSWAAGGADHEMPRAIQPASSGGVYVTGSSKSGKISVGEQTYVNAGSEDWVVSALDSAGKPRWSWHLGGPFQDRPTTAFESHDGKRVIVVGNARGSITLSNGATWTTASKADVMIAELDAETGTLLNHRSFGGEGDQRAYFAAEDSGGELWIGGHFIGALGLDDGKPVTATKQTQYLAKFDKTGATRFVLQSAGNPKEYFWAGAVGPDDALTMLGDLSGTQNIGGQVMTFDHGEADVALIRFDANGKVVFWKGWGTPGDDWSGGVAPLADGGVVIAFSLRGPTTLDGIDLPFTGGRDAGLAQVDKTGKVVWARMFAGTGFDNPARPIVLPDGGIALTVFTRGTFDAGGGPLQRSLRADTVLAVLTNTGEHVWSRRFGTHRNEEVLVSTVGSDGKLWVLGGVDQTLSGLASGGGIDWIGRRYPLK